MTTPEERRIREALRNSVPEINSDPDLEDLERRRARSVRRRAGALAGATFLVLVVAAVALIGSGTFRGGSDSTESLRLAVRTPQTTARPSTTPPTTVALTTTSSTTVAPTTVAPTTAPSTMPRTDLQRTELPPATIGTTTTQNPTTTTQPAPVTATCPQSSGLTSDQATIRNQINSARASQGRGSLAVCSWAQNKAQSWADHLARTGAFYHSNLSSGYPGDLGCFSNAENLGRGYDLGSIHNGFLNSSTHRNNMLNPQYQYVGTGVAKNTATGEYFVVHEYLGLC